MAWTKLVSLETIQREKKISISLDRLKVVAFYVNDNVYVCEARCPHQGYPLIEGDVSEKDCVLTCQWHNWKFSLLDGKNQFHGDKLAVFDTQIEEGFVFVNIPQKTDQELQTEYLSELQEAFSRNQYGRISRTMGKVLLSRLDPLPLLSRVVDWSFERFEFGLTHAYAALADWIELYSVHSSDTELQLIALTEAIDHVSWDTLRHPLLPYTTQETFFEGSLLYDAVLAENEDRAISLLNGAQKQKIQWQELKHWLARATLAHYRDFGHPLIYLDKIAKLFSWLGEETGYKALKPFLRLLCNTTNENLLPDFKHYAQTLQQMQPFPVISLSPVSALQDDLSISQTFQWLLENNASASFEDMWKTLVIGSAKHLFFFNTEFETGIPSKIKDNVGWLDFTHALTFANTARILGAEYPDLREQLLLQMACFYGRGNKYIDTKQAMLDLTDSAELFFQEMYDFLFDHGNDLRSRSCHYLKNIRAFEKLYFELPVSSERKWLLLGLKRYITEQRKTKHIRRVARQNLKLLS